MVTSSKIIQKIKDIIDGRYANLLISLVGKNSLSPEDLKKLRSKGVRISDNPSLLELAYYHALLHHRNDDQKPTSLEEMKTHQNLAKKPKRKEFEYSAKHTNESMKLAVEKMKTDITTRIISAIQENNQTSKFNSLRTQPQTEEVQKLVRESTVGQLKRKLRDMSGDANRDWQRIAVTEVSHAIAAGAADQVISQNEGLDPNEIYVYKISVQDSALCNFCKQFYVDSDGSPKLYTLNYLLGNGSNFGKKKSEWLPTVGPAHPRDRESGILELKPGFMLLPGGHSTYIGPKEWNEYLIKKLQK